MTIKIGFCGGHRTGKTTLAQSVSERLGLTFVKTHTSSIFAQHGLDPAKSMNFQTRLWIQQKVLLAAKTSWEKEKKGFITDRTPLDFIAYTLCDIQGDTEVDMTALNSYITDCFETTSSCFTLLTLIQPGIPLIYDKGKAALNEAYIEHLNTTLLGLCHDERLNCSTLVIERNTLSIEARMRSILASLPYAA